MVTHLDFKQNALHVAFDREDSPLLYASEAEIDSIQFINKPIESACSIQAKPRYRDSSKSITYTPKSNATAHIHFQEPQRALAEGQILALYHDNRLLGGGLYSKIIPAIPSHIHD